MAFPKIFNGGGCYKYNSTFYNNFFLITNKSISNDSKTALN